MNVVYVGESAAERDHVRRRLRGSRAPIRFAWALGLADLLGQRLPEGLILVLGTQVTPHDRLRILSLLSQEPTARVIVLGEGPPGPFGTPVPIEQLSARVLVERAVRARAPALDLPAPAPRGALKED